MSVHIKVVDLVGSGYFATATATAPIETPAPTDSKKKKKQIKQGSKSQGGKSNVTNLVFVIDRSGSMGQHVNALVTKTLPHVMRKLGCATCSLFTFDTFAEAYHRQTPSLLEKSSMGARGCTNFSKCIELLVAHLLATDGNVRILTISDGYMHDIERAAAKASELEPSVRSGKQRLINSQAIRFITSASGQPDTRGLSSVLQFNNACQVDLVDWHAHTSVGSYSSLGDLIANMFLGDGLDNSLHLEASPALGNAAVIMPNPWDEAQKSIVLNDKGETSFWLSALPESEGDEAPFIAYTTEGESLSVTFEIERAPTTQVEVDAALKNALELYMQRIRILQVLNTETSREKVQTIANYFQELQQRLTAIADAAESKDVAASVIPSTRDRLYRLKRVIAQRHKSLLGQLCELANNDKVAQLNSLQQAEYLRQTVVSKNAKGLARRAGGVDGSEMDVDATIRAEVAAIGKNIGELAHIDDSSHLTSFWSMETTLGSLRALADFVSADDGTIEHMAVSEILRCVSIVGVAARGQIGDYPDPMTWRADEVYAGCFVSVADITEHALFSIRESMSSGQAPELTVPGSNHGKVITNAIPVFDHPQIHRFLKKHAPTLLECSAGVGMRRMIATVPMTHAYTVLSGAWACTDMLLRQDPAERTHVDCATSWKLFRDASIAFGKYFARVYASLVDGVGKVGTLGNSASVVNDGTGESEQQQQQQDEEEEEAKAEAEAEEDEASTRPECLTRPVHYIANNGLSNMLLVLFYACKQDLKYDRASVLRAIYNYECYQFTKKILNKHAEDKPGFIMQSLKSLLLLDYDSHCVDVGGPFTPTPPFSFEFELAPDAALVAKMTFAFKWVETCCFIPRVLKCFVGAYRTAHGHPTADTDTGADTDADTSADISARLAREEDEVVSGLRSLPQLDAAVFKDALEIAPDVSMEAYRATQLLQGLKYHSKQLRCDDDAAQMRVEDVQTLEQCTLFARELVGSIYRIEYDARSKAKQASEYSAAVEKLVLALLNTNDVLAFVKLFKEGLVYKGVQAHIKNESSEGVKDIVASLADLTLNVPARLEKIGAFMMAKLTGTKTSGETCDVVMWNNGNAYRGDTSCFEAAFTHEGAQKKWYSLKKKHKEACVHLYRDAPNRHGHGNDNPSFWALGFKTLDEMHRTVSITAFEEYRLAHADCCGFRSGVHPNHFLN